MYVSTTAGRRLDNRSATHFFLWVVSLRFIVWQRRFENRHAKVLLIQVNTVGRDSFDQVLATGKDKVVDCVEPLCVGNVAIRNRTNIETYVQLPARSIFPIWVPQVEGNLLF